ncbi:MAG: CAP domain-containing protein [Patescibacteria group bacterium]|nr:CAP domain-containing protein [Patescibacteria group bacterium]
MQVSQNFNKKNFFIIPLIFVLLGIFLLPKLALLSAITPETIIKISNQERKKYGLEALSANQSLSQAAYRKADAIFSSQHFTHRIGNRKFSAWVKDAGYKYSYVGENLAVDFITAEGVVIAWLNSQTHKKNLLNKQFSEIGIAVVEGKFQGQSTTLVVQIFGAPLIPITASAPQATSYIPSPININSPPITRNIFENTIIQAKYLPGFLGQGQRQLLGILSLSGIVLLSQHAVSFILFSIILTLVFFFFALISTHNIKQNN